jgi:hypothetical protein
MNRSIWMAAVLSGAMVAATALAGDVKSGPEVGKTIPGPFTPLHCNGPTEDQKVCLVCKNGPNPVAMIFARDVSDNLTALVKKIDAATVEHSKQSMGSFVVFCSDEESLKGRLKDLAKKEKLQEIILSIDQPTGPEAYKVSKDADVTVVLYNNRVVKANYAFKKGELKEADIKTIMQDVEKMLADK